MPTKIEINKRRLERDRDDDKTETQRDVTARCEQQQKIQIYRTIFRFGLSLLNKLQFNGTRASYFFFFALFFTCCCWLCNVHVHHVCFVQQFTSSSITSHWNYAYSSSSKIFEHKNFLITSYNSRGSSHIYYIHNVYILHLLFRTLTIVVNSIISHNLFGSCFRLLLVLLLYCMWFCAKKKNKEKWHEYPFRVHFAQFFCCFHSYLSIQSAADRGLAPNQNHSASQSPHSFIFSPNIKKKYRKENTSVLPCMNSGNPGNER